MAYYVHRLLFQYKFQKRKINVRNTHSHIIKCAQKAAATLPSFVAPFMINATFPSTHSRIVVQNLQICCCFCYHTTLHITHALFYSIYSLPPAGDSSCSAQVFIEWEEIFFLSIFVVVIQNKLHKSNMVISRRNVIFIRLPFWWFVISVSFWR